MPKMPHEEHENHERYLVTYADLITLLLGLFVILYASAKVDTPKYIVVSKAMRNFFTGSGKVIDRGGARGGLMPMLPNPSKTGGEEAMTRMEATIAEAIERMAATNGTAAGTAGEGTDSTSHIQVEMQERGSVIHLAESMFFDPGTAYIKSEGLRALDVVAPSLKTTMRLIRIEGHTDNTPIQTTLYPSNWHLSTASAITTATYLIEHHHIPSVRV